MLRRRITSAIFYDTGQGVVQDYAQAVYWYRKAADQADATGLNNLGVMYMHGRGVPFDEAEAMRWFEKAAAAGQAKAFTNKALLYLYGISTPRNLSLALDLFTQAMRRGDTSAKPLLSKVQKAMMEHAVSSFRNRAGSESGPEVVH